MGKVKLPKLNKLYTRKQIDSLRESLILRHGDVCAICKKPRSAFKNSLSVDHNHITSKVRGLLCYRCNKFRVGRQTIETCREVLEYLLKYDKPEVK
jgi:hypothetical protein